MRRVLWAALGTASLVASCGKNGPEAFPPAAAPAPLARPRASMARATMPFAIAEDGTTTIDLPAQKEHLRAKTTGSAGALEIDLHDLAETRGEVRIDMLTLKTSTFDDAEKDTEQTRHALIWLQALVEGEVVEANRWATFFIRKIDDLSAARVADIPSAREGGLDVRVATMMAHGTLHLHGHGAPKDVRLETRFFFPMGSAAEAAPTRIVVRSLTPLRFVLAEHDIWPRDKFGKIARNAFNLMGVKVGEAADITLLLSATPASRAAPKP